MRMNHQARLPRQLRAISSPPARGTSRRPRGKNWLKAALVSVALTTFAFVPALAEPMTFTVTGRGNLLVAHYQEHAGICAGDAQGIARPKHGATDFQVVSYPVGQAVPRNLDTSTGHPQTTQVMDASATYLVAALYHLFRPAPNDGELAAESFAWAVQNQLSSWGWFSTLAPSDGGQLGRQMLTEARTWAGPYQVGAQFEVGGDPWQLQLTDVGVQSATGKWLPGLPGTITLHGAAFDNGASTYTFTTADQPLQVPLRASRSGKVRAEINIEGLPAAQINILESSKHQDLVSVAPQTGSAHGHSEITVTHPPLDVDFHTQVEAGTLSPDQPAIDNIFVSAQQWPTDSSGQGLALRLRARLYGPMEEPPTYSEQVPSDAPLAGETILTVHGSGAYQVSLDPVASATADPAAGPQWPVGYYTWVVAALDADQRSGGAGADGAVRLEREVVSAFGIEQESFEVVAPPTPAPPQQSAPPAVDATPGPSHRATCQRPTSPHRGDGPIGANRGNRPHRPISNAAGARLSP